MSMDRDSENFDDDMEFIYKYIIDNDNETEHLPIPVYSFIKPIVGTLFILHLLLSMGNISTELNLTRHATVRDYLRSTKLIDELDDEKSLQV